MRAVPTPQALEAANSPMTAAPLLRAYGLKRRLGGLQVTDDVTIGVACDQIHALIGPNGAGKTTLVNQLSGVLAPQAGRIELDGQDVTALPMPSRVSRGLVRSFQIPTVMAGFTPREHLLMALMAPIRGWRDWLRPVAGRRELGEQADALLDRVGLPSASRAVGELSYGEKRRLEIALAVAMRPKVLLLDEPMAGLSAQESEQMGELIREIAPGRGILLIEHDMRIVFGLSQTVSVLVNGRLIASGPPERIRTDPQVRAAYLGDAHPSGPPA